MAVNKTVNKRTNSHGAMRNCIEYVLRQDKTSEQFAYVTGPYCYDVINYDLVYRTFLKKRNYGIKTPEECTPTTLFHGIRTSRSSRSRHLNLEKNLQKSGFRVFRHWWRFIRIKIISIAIW